MDKKLEVEDEKDSRVFTASHWGYRSVAESLPSRHKAPVTAPEPYKLDMVAKACHSSSWDLIIEKSEV